LRLRLSDAAPGSIGRDPLGKDFTKVLTARRSEADDFYNETIPRSIPDPQRHVIRQALAGMLWSKQFYDYDVTTWLKERAGETQAPPTRNGDWQHMVNGDVISMPDKWEYPWYAAWDLAFHALPLGMVDLDFAKQQLTLLLKERYLHPNGQVPAYEWNFGDVNPPVHAWGAYVLFQYERERTGKGDIAFLKTIYHKLLLNFTWWVNRKDRNGRNVFEGGFLGLDNIGVFDRSAPLPGGGHLEQADGTAWMAFYTQVMLQISLELAAEDSTYVEMALKFFEHFIWIASAMTHIGGGSQMWDEEDGFFYDVLRTPEGGATRLKVRSMVGLLPLAAATVLHRAAARADARPGRAVRPARHWVPRAPRRAGRQHARPAQAGLQRPQAAVHPHRGPPAPRARPHARRGGVPQPLSASARCRRNIAPSRTTSGSGAEIQRRLPAGGVRQRHVRRQLELARADLDAGERAAHPVAAELLRLLRRRLQDGLPDRVGAKDEPLPDRRRADPEAGGHLQPRRRGPPAGLRRRAASSATTVCGATTSSTTSTSTATTARASGPATRPAGPA
jgi:hypothetical protein